VILSGATNNYTGPTTISAGTLEIAAVRASAAAPLSWRKTARSFG